MHAWKIEREANDDNGDDDDDDNGDDDGNEFLKYLFLIFKQSRLMLAGQQLPNLCTS